VRECGMPLAFDQFSSPEEGKEVRRLMEFLCTFINLIKDGKSMLGLRNVVFSSTFPFTIPYISSPH
jgi:hypothetical protein